MHARAYVEKSTSQNECFAWQRMWADQFKSSPAEQEEEPYRAGTELETKSHSVTTLYSCLLKLPSRGNSKTFPIRPETFYAGATASEQNRSDQSYYSGLTVKKDQAAARNHTQQLLPGSPTASLCSQHSMSVGVTTTQKSVSTAIVELECDPQTRNTMLFNTKAK